MSHRSRAAGFEDAFDGLAVVAHRVAYRLLGDRDDADEVAQEALARAYLRWGRVEGHAEPWVARVASNLALDRHRRRSREGRLRIIHEPRPGAEADRSDGLVTRMELVAGLRALPRRQREAVVLRYLADVSEAATAELLGCTPGTVKQHAHRGLAALRLSIPGPGSDRPSEPASPVEPGSTTTPPTRR